MIAGWNVTEAVLSIDWAGPLVTVQDGGRPGLMRYGVPRSGPMDRRAFAAANLALGNTRDAPAVEISLGGLTLTCLSGTVGFAVAGGGFILDHAGTRRGSWSMATLRQGERLTIRRGPWGSWCYLALAGAVQVPHWLGSSATHAQSGMGGGKLTAGQVLTVGQSDRQLNDGPIPCPIAARPRPLARVTIGPQDRCFSAEALETFLAGPWRMTEAWDRMGVRLAGPSIAPDVTLDMPSEPVLRGSVQVAGDGVASLLLADHQTTGGYPKIATVLDCDLDAVMQLRPRDRLQFRAVRPDEAIALARSTAAADQSYFRALIGATTG